MLNEVVVESVEEEDSVDCPSDEIDTNEQCDQSLYMYEARIVQKLVSNFLLFFLEKR